jgi:hypothetical protein
MISILYRVIVSAAPGGAVFHLLIRAGSSRASRPAWSATCEPICVPTAAAASMKMA